MGNSETPNPFFGSLGVKFIVGLLWLCGSAQAAEPYDNTFSRDTVFFFLEFFEESPEGVNFWGEEPEPDQLPGESLPGTPFSFPVSQVSTTDPAGHSCCISIPFGEFSLTWQGENRFVIGQNEGAAVLRYLPLEVEVSSSGEISGEGESTVAGYSGVSTKASGGFTAEGIDLQLEVGENGALPSGLPITFDLFLAYEGILHFSQIAAPVLGLDAATGQTVSSWEVDPDQSIDFNLFLQLDGDLGNTASDWFIMMLTPAGEVSSFNLGTFQFEPGVRPTYQGPLVELPATRLFGSPVLPEEGSIIAFGVDAMDGQLNDDVTFNAIEIIYAN
jgi:hypothetical protein